ncbi:hypothetical protein PC113_g3948 [Phytophthora cactorum]|uniref:PLAC8 motif-containing protein n=1 Tax=Phytophthora cactorum TaxID=29920 RepID=A0A8T1EGU1_9STRA|nr:hypothetical protein PC113_g3948 [Phytophthora cactorum]KAG2935490.1 hypothetical protein PC114_g500 [Phytophthora cactorum]KAG2950837.1 hypothetical protein PC117_g4079 [Phytophthora cactorum]KAG3027979.1 hypothetical protein PC120_g5105 [Phytophthora cactorum]KAG3189758.1 hypothetical protein C6341_g2082 [Phytophthora cactorum]
MKSNQVANAPADLENGWVRQDSTQVSSNEGAQQYASVVPFSDDTPLMTGSWLVGLCGCCTDLIPNCCMVTFCPCISLAQISKRLGVTSNATKIPNPRKLLSRLLRSMLLSMLRGRPNGDSNRKLHTR